jgi:hypothetical protein
VTAADYINSALAAIEIAGIKLGKPDRNATASATVSAAIVNAYWGQASPAVNAYSVGDEDGELDGSRVFDLTLPTAFNDDLKENIMNEFDTMVAKGWISSATLDGGTIEVVLDHGVTLSGMTA